MLAEEVPSLEVVSLTRNMGKGAALQAGIRLVLDKAEDEDLLVIQDADLEYDPNDLPDLVAHFEDRALDAVVGDRFESGRRCSDLGRTHQLVNLFLTWLSNRFTGLGLKDMECCYKMMRIPMTRKVLEDLSEMRFGVEPQIAASLARNNARIRNHVIHYDARRFDEGKKIGVMDGIRAIFVIFRESFRKRNVG